MQKKHNLLKKITLICIALLLGIVAWGGLIPEIALSQQQQSRLNAVEIDINRIETRLNRIESQIGQVGRFGASRPPVEPPPQSSNNSGRNQPQLSREQMFDRLATLVIELREQIKELEARVSKLES